MQQAAAILAAAGRGVRFGAEKPKQYLLLAGEPVIRHSARVLRAHPAIGAIIAAVAEEDRSCAEAALAGLDVRLVTGEATRTGSVRAALAALRCDPPGAVLIHDAARPSLSAGVIDRVLAALHGADGSAPALPLADALKRIDAQGRVIDDVARDGLMRVQTPQGFDFARLLAAYDALPVDANLPDDIAVAQRAGLVIRLTSGDPDLEKLTFPHDLARAELRLAASGATHVGFGVDAHRFGPGAFVTLCGVELAHDQGLLGHSDADAAWHALTDALLGALGEGDIGDHFPPTDLRWKGAPSRIFLAFAGERVRARGGRIINVDITILAEAPRIKPHRSAMQKSTAEVLGLDPRRVGVKATTTEKMGFTGRGEGLAAQASASVFLPL
jgi:2-C-methyl-D-erythritol 4-phosphate cytidylyltransferase/2-C-methyl-D-erythritol 2,4-cyclodiphosphate synthase